MAVACKKELFHCSQNKYDEHYNKNETQDHTLWRTYSNCSITTFSHSHSVARSWSKHQLTWCLSLLLTHMSKANTRDPPYFGQTYW